MFWVNCQLDIDLEEIARKLKKGQQETFIFKGCNNIGVKVDLDVITF